ncbi:MAG: chemotaxis response regulator protein-glutamate methylesterase [Bacteroides sp.]|nr:chemotaxis response regulator protein-glutamate methylesterase [Prevotella sp.]MCM1408431.1 chemotaxis response regulator protein-glutamate methylesterase [Treponema brennaborense]MCM1469407.1 chemotaxis response regulator protein-glutamate methylesterase [Bacteroides sp.]
MDDINVLVVDDSALMRNIISRIIENTPGLAVAGKAMNGEFALEKIPVCHPDIIVSDIEMPVMGGIEFLKERKKRGIDIPVIILSSVAVEGAAVTMQCLELGASDFVTKPSSAVSDGIHAVADRLSELLVSYGGQYARRHNKSPVTLSQMPSFSHSSASSASSKLPPAGDAAQRLSGFAGRDDAHSFQAPSFSDRRSSLHPSANAKNQPVTPIRDGGRIELIAIGISTGGPNALREVFAEISPSVSQPIVVVQHMPAGFTAEFANSLDAICPLEVKEAAEGDVLKSGRILIAPGNYHLVVEQRALASIVHLSDAAPCNGHRPSVDVLFESIAKSYQNRALGVIMTGMGRDGTAGLIEMRRQGAYTLGQDEESSVVYGMPKVAFEQGAVQKQVPLSKMADAISSLAMSRQ